MKKTRRCGGGGMAPRVKRSGTNTSAPRKSKVVVEFPCTVRSFSEAIGLPVTQVLREMMAMGSMGNVNTQIDPEMAQLLAVALGVDAEFKMEVDLAEQTISQLTEARRSGPARAAPAGNHVLGTRQPRQDVAVGPHHRHRRGQWRKRRYHAAYPCLSNRKGWAEDFVRRYARSRGIHRNACPRRQRHRYRGAGRGGR